MNIAFAAPVDAPPILAVDMIDVVKFAAEHTPRSLQRNIGPSEIGAECLRRLGFSALQYPSVKTLDPWPAFIGTATHKELALAFELDNRRWVLGGSPRWLVEHKVTVAPGITGTLDLYDTYSQSVIDHKILGAASMKVAREAGPSPQYRAQGQLYGLGLASAGYPVREIIIAAYPRSGWLDGPSGMRLYREPYDPAAAEAALERLTGVVALTESLDVFAHPERWALVPSADACTWCPFHQPDIEQPGPGVCPGR